MLPSLSENGLDFTSSWVLFSTTPYKIEPSFGDHLYIGFKFYGQPLPNYPFISVTPDLSWTVSYSKNIFREELTPIIFYALNSLKQLILSQNQVDAIVSFLHFFSTTAPLETFRNTEIFKALIDKEPPNIVSSLIEDFYKNTSWDEDLLRKFGIFFDPLTRGALESSLYLNSLYNPCPFLNVHEKIVDNIKVFY